VAVTTAPVAAAGPQAGAGGGVAPTSLPSAGKSVVADAGLSTFSLVGLAALLAVAAIVMRGGWSSTRALALRSQAAVRALPAARRTDQTATCRSCDGPLHPSDFFCASCGDARYRLIRPQR
jgi:hypothetical protein